jgi:copper homeostasis protein CutC
VVDGLTVTLNEKFVVTEKGGLQLSRIELKDGLAIEGTTISYGQS